MPKVAAKLGSEHRSECPVKTPADLDAAQAVAFDELFMEGEAAAVGQKMYAAALFFNNEIVEKDRDLRGARQALKGWNKLAPACSRLPLPYEVLAAAVMKLWKDKDVETALWAWLQFELYLRPSEG